MFSASHQYLDDGVFAISVTVTDDDDALDTAVTSIEVSSVAPTVAVDDTTVTVHESERATNTGTFADVGDDTVAITASVGTVTRYHETKTWSWSYTPVDGPSDSRKVTITAEDDDGGVATTAFDLVTLNAPPEVVGISLSDTTIDESGTVQLSGSFRDAGTVDAHASRIEWGDGTSSAAAVDQATRRFSASHQYLDDGVYAISVSVTDDDGGHDEEQTSIKVANLPPQPRIAGVNQASKGSHVSLFAYATDPAGLFDPLTLAWTVTRSGTDFAIGEGSRIEFMPDEAGTYEVRLTASDDDSGIGETAMTVVVVNQAPVVATDYATRTVDEGRTARNSGTVFDPADDPVTLAASVGEVIDRGDGTWSWNFASTDGPDESQTVIITATDRDGAESRTSFELVANNVAPQFEAGPDESLSPAVEGDFRRTGIRFIDPGADDWSGTVDFGDSAGVQALTIDPLTKTFDLRHVYTTADAYRVSVTMQDDDGASYSDSFGVDVSLAEVDTTPPVSQVDPLPMTATSLLFDVSVTGSDPEPGPDGSASGVSYFDVYVSVDNGPFTLWKSLPASQPFATFLGESNHLYGFRSVAGDAAGNLESKPVSVEASIYVPDLSPPATAVTAVGTVTSTFIVDFEGTDIGDTGLSQVDVIVQVDGGTLQNLGAVAVGVPDSAGVYHGSILYQAIADGDPHSYRFYAVGEDAVGNRESAPASAAADIVVAAAYPPPVSFQPTNFDVQRGAAQRSFIRYLDVLFNLDTGLQQLIDTANDADAANDRIRLQRFGLDGSGPGVDVSLGGLVRANGDRLSLDFGSQGIAGNRNSSTGNGYYDLAFDLDGNGSFETNFHFHRLFGDINGDRIVDALDVAAIVAAFGKTGPKLDGDANGDGYVNALDRLFALQNTGQFVAPSLPIDD